MTDMILVIVPAVLIFGTLSLSLIFLLLAVYDLAVARRCTKPKNNVRPKITVIVMSNSTTKALSDCLTSLRKTRYRKLDVVVVGVGDRGTKLAKAKKLVKRYAHVRYYRPCKKYDHSRLAQEAYKRSHKGTIVVVIDSSVLITGATLGNIVRSGDSIRSGKIIRFQFNSSDYGLKGVVMSLKGSAHRMFVKLISVLHVPVPVMQQSSGYALANSLVMTNRRNDLGRMYAVTAVRIKHARLGIAFKFGSGKRVYFELLKIVVLTSIICVAFFMVQAAVEGSGIEALSISWVLIAVAATFLVLFDTHTNSRQKIETVACIGFMPIMVLIACSTSIKSDTSA